MKTTAKGKIYGKDPQTLQNIADTIRNTFSPRCSVSRPQPSDRGDYHILLTIYIGEQQ